MDFDLSKIETFNGSQFKQCEERILFLLEMAGLVIVLTKPKAEEITKSVVSQLDTFQLMVNDLATENMVISESFVVALLIKKLSP